eukprot:1136435-Pelagomonas_calceolata.AAC.11
MVAPSKNTVYLFRFSGDSNLDQETAYNSKNEAETERGSSLLKNRVSDTALDFIFKATSCFTLYKAMKLPAVNEP